MNSRPWECRACGVKMDVSQKEEVEAMVDEAGRTMGRVDILVNCAGVNIRKMPQDYALDEWQWVLDVNLTGSFLCSQAVYPWMRKAGGGKIINIGSMTSVFGGGWATVYAVSKGGVVQLTRSLAMAWAKDSIQVNAVLPGWILTEMTAPIAENEPERHAQICSRIPMGFWGKPSDLAGVAVFLASRASDYVTGASIPVDGGYLIA